MKRKDWIIIIAPLFAVWLIDYTSKLWAKTLSGPIDFEYLSIRLYHNHGAFLGAFSELPHLLRIVSVSTIAAFLVFSYAIIQYMLPIKSLRLRLGMSILLGGIIGNVWDRILWGYVVDFLVFDFGSFSLHPMNIADIFQWVGYFFIAVAILREEDLLWPEQNNRKRLWINPDYQLRYILFLLLIALSLTLIGMIFSYTYLKVTIFELIGDNRYIPERFLVPFILTYVIISLIFCGFLVFIGRKVSHRNAGPIFAFEKYINDLMEGRNRRFTLRSGDEFRQLETIGAKIAVFLAENNLIDTEDQVKTLTTQKYNADDLSIGAVAADEYLPDYSSRNANLHAVLAMAPKKMERDCPLCQKPSHVLHESTISSELVECVHCCFVFDATQGPVITGRQEFLFRNQSEIEAQKETYRSAQQSISRIQKKFGSIGSCLWVDFSNVGTLMGLRSENIALIHATEKIESTTQAAAQLGFSVFPGDLPSVQNQLEHYDLVSAGDALTFCSDPNEILLPALNHLKENGLLLLEVPNVDSFSARFFGRKWWHARDSRRRLFFSPETIRELLAQRGLTPILVENAWSPLSLGHLGEILELYGWKILSKPIALLPKKLREAIVLSVPTGKIRVVARQQSTDKITAGMPPENIKDTP